MTSPAKPASAPPRRPTIKMVADLAGVSTATVSYVLSGRGGRKTATRDETARRVHEAVETLGYRRNEAARSIRTGASGFAVLSLTMLSDPWSLDLVDAARAAFGASGITPLILADADWRGFVGSHSPDVVFIDGLPTPGAERDAYVDSLRALAQQGQKIVVVGDDALEPDGFDVVYTSSFPGCDDAMTYLLQGHDRIGCITLNAELTDHGQRTRFSAYARGLESAGRPLDASLVAVSQRDSMSAYAAALRLLDRPDRPTAIFATSDFMAVAALQAASSLGLGVPHDVSILGVGNTELGAKLSPTLTSVGPTNFFPTLAQHLAKRAREASCGPGVRLEFSWHVIERESTRRSNPPRRTHD